MKRAKLFYALLGLLLAVGGTIGLPETAIAQTLLQEQGQLEPGDAVLEADGSLYDRYSLEGQAGQQITITLESSAFDTYLLLINADGNKIGESDDIDQTNSNSSLTITLPANGTYTIVVNSYDNTGRGSYRLTVNAGSGSAANSLPNSAANSVSPDAAANASTSDTSADNTEAQNPTAPRTAFSGDVRAEYSEQAGSSCVTRPQVAISRADQVVFDQALDIREFCRQSGPFRVQDLDGDREPEVILGFFSGGAHCCTFSLIFSYDADRQQYSYLQQPWGNVGFSLEDIDRDGLPEFESADDRFAYQFSSFAGSGFPIQIWQYRQNRLVDVTRNYRNQIYDSAYRHWQLYTQARDGVDGGRGLLAAYLAEKYLLGEAEDGWNRVRSAYQASDRQQFFADLAQFLQQTRYATRQ